MLHDHFLRARRSTHGAVAVVSPDRLLVNAPAARLLRDSDRELLWDLVEDNTREESEIVLSDGRTVAIRAESVVDAGRRIGALVHLGPRSQDGGSRNAWCGCVDSSPWWMGESVRDRTNSGGTGRGGSYKSRGRGPACAFTAHDRLPPSPDLREARRDVASGDDASGAGASGRPYLKALVEVRTAGL